MSNKLKKPMNKAFDIICILLFVTATLCVMSIFYEGMNLEWYGFVPVLMIATDGFFILAAIFGLVLKRKIKVLLYLNIFSVVIITVAFVTKFIGIEHPKWCVTIWYFYILYFYGILVLSNIRKKAN